MSGATMHGHVMDESWQHVHQVLGFGRPLKERKKDNWHQWFSEQNYVNFYQKRIFLQMSHTWKVNAKKYTSCVSVCQLWRKQWVTHATHTHMISTSSCVSVCIMAGNSSHKKLYFEHIKLVAKLLDYFLQSNKSNIYQSRDTHTHAAGCTKKIQTKARISQFTDK